MASVAQHHVLNACAALAAAGVAVLHVDPEDGKIAVDVPDSPFIAWLDRDGGDEAWLCYLTDAREDATSYYLDFRPAADAAEATAWIRGLLDGTIDPESGAIH